MRKSRVASRPLSRMRGRSISTGCSPRLQNARRRFPIVLNHEARVTRDKHDRDVIVDRLLARAMPPQPDDASAACLDVETLAAWADNALDANARAAAEAHAAGCARCQAMLAAMARTAPEPDAARAATSRWRLPLSGWLIPSAAAAIAVLVWVMVPARTDPVVVHQETKLAKSSPSSLATVPSSSTRETPAAGPADAGAPSSALDATSGAPHDRRARREDTKTDKDAALRLDRASPAPEAGASAPAPAAAATAKLFSAGEAETVVVSSNPASRWRIQQAGAVQRSTDGGATWQVQSTGVTETLSAGSSPSPSVCWLVGPGGAVVLSTDGRSWTRVAFPEAVSLAAVRATDDKVATVTTADGREFVTDDGGLTWRKAPE